ncbi:hypothetical protein SE92_33765 [Bradyrhizobium sp. AT1]|uniref:hypothetical protein n=1 Tax=Bradyrhizobium sp. AT1 TaxID=574934 RepID=UPI000792924F|nr:hypothetical protein [Bradyrhizobium sp. AT1]KYG24601.1 hypothetical protein SE92_33765 [Bradyrhizobium sp. AT1]
MKFSSASLSLTLASLFFLLPVSLALLYPISFWLGNDYEPLGLANAFNLAFRLGHHHMYPAIGLTNHPGLPFYYTSWLALALSGHPFASNPLDFFNSVLDQVRTYQLCAIALTSFVGACGVYLFVRITYPLLPSSVIVLSLAVWLLSTPATITNFLSPSNEAFALVINVLFLLSLFQISRDERGTTRTIAIAAAVSAVAYLNKLSYIYVPAALCASMFAQYGFPLKRIAILVRSLAMFVVAFVGLVCLVGYIVIGWDEFRALLLFHRSVAFRSGLYGAGDQTLANLEEILKAVYSIPSHRAFALPLALLAGVGLLIIAGTLLLRSRQPRPELTVGVGCGTAAALSALFVFKHYDFHYSAGVSATLPGCVVAYQLLIRRRPSRIKLLLVSAALLLMAFPVVQRLHLYLVDRTERTNAALLDKDEIAKLNARQKKVLDYAYRVPFREYGEGFILTYAGVEPLTKAYVSDRRGTTNSFVEALVSEEVGAYVIDKSYFPTAEAVKAAANVDLLGPKSVRYQDGDTLIELRTVFVLLRRAE